MTYDDPEMTTKSLSLGQGGMRQFRAAWEKFSADPARLTEFLQAKRKRLR